jgi:hypothetical protein
MKLSRILHTVAVILCASVLATLSQAQTTIKWQGYTWFVRSAGLEGPGPNKWDPANVFVDAKGFLHLKIANANGQWTCAEIWTNQDLGFGTYQCQVEGPLDRLDPNIVFSMFSYAGPDGTKEIDIEFAKWGHPAEKNGWWTVWPNDSAGKKISHGFNVKLDGAYTTSRFAWSSTGVDYWFLGGHQAIDSDTNLLEAWQDRPDSPEHQVTQTKMPLHFNLWLFQGKPPTDGKPVEIIVHSFEKK